MAVCGSVSMLGEVYMLGPIAFNAGAVTIAADMLIGQSLSLHGHVCVTGAVSGWHSLYAESLSIDSQLVLAGPVLAI